LQQKAVLTRTSVRVFHLALIVSAAHQLGARCGGFVVQVRQIEQTWLKKPNTFCRLPRYLMKYPQFSKHPLENSIANRFIRSSW